MANLTLDQANTIVDVALAEGRATDCQPLTVVVLDAGGAPIRDRDGAAIGAVGVSGDSSDRDEVCAVAGVEGAGLVADAGA